MKVGKLLKEKYGFDKQETIDQFVDIFGYSETIVNKILDDKYPVLLTCHIQDFALFTNASEDELYEAQELPSEVDPLRPFTPMGKPYVHTLPAFGIIGLSTHKVYPTQPSELKPTKSLDYPPILNMNASVQSDAALQDLFQRVKQFHKQTSFVLKPIRSEITIKDLDERVQEAHEVTPMTAYLRRKYPQLRNDPEFDISKTVFRYPLGSDKLGLAVTSDKPTEMTNEDFKKIIDLAVEYFNRPENIKEAQQQLKIDYPIEFVPGYSYTPNNPLSSQDIINHLDNFTPLPNIKDEDK